MSTCLVGNRGIRVYGEVRIDGSAVALNQWIAPTGAPAEAGRKTAIAELRAAAQLLLEQLRRDQDRYEYGAELVEAEPTREEPRRNALQCWLDVIAPSVQTTAAAAHVESSAQR